MNACIYEVLRKYLCHSTIRQECGGQIISVKSEIIRLFRFDAAFSTSFLSAEFEADTLLGMLLMPTSKGDNMRENLKPFPLITLEGTWHEMGVQYGEDCAQEIAYMVNWWEGLMKSANPDFSLEEAKRLGVKHYLAETKEYSPRVVEFMEGIAQGASLDFESVFFVNVASELMGGSSSLGVGMEGCTTFAVQGTHMEDGKTIVAQNVDWHPSLKVVVLRMRPVDAPAFLSITFAGDTPQIGISSAGYGLMVNSLLSANRQDGVPMYAICTEALAQETLERGMERVSMAKRAMSFNYCFARKDGSMLDIETVVDDFQPIIRENGRIVHSNHFQTPRFQAGDLCKCFVDTFIRYTQARDMLDARPKHTVETLKEILRDHHGDPTAAICCHPMTDLGYVDAYASVISAIGVIEDGVIYATEYPCKNDYTEYRL